MVLTGTTSLVVLLHEIGHAIAARSRGCKVYSIEMHLAHGQTMHSPPWSERDSIVIAWGGVLAQLAVAIPACAWLRWGTAGDVIRLALFMFGPGSLAIVVLNLLPVAGLDGATAWSFLRRRRRTKAASPLRFPRR